MLEARLLYRIAQKYKTAREFRTAQDKTAREFRTARDKTAREFRTAWDRTARECRTTQEFKTAQVHKYLTIKDK